MIKQLLIIVFIVLYADHLFGQWMPQDSSHPLLLINKKGFDHVKANIQAYPWAKDAYHELIADANLWLEKPIRIPPRGGNWLHYYVSPKDGSLLNCGKEIGPWQWEHVSTSTGEIFRGDSSVLRYDFDGCVLYQQHQHLANALYLLGFAFRVSGNVKYASKAKTILLGYTDIYLKLPIRDKTGTANLNDSTGSGHVFVQSLDEAVWLTTILQGTDMIWDQLTGEEKKYVTERFFLPATDVIMAHRMEVHNIQCWKNAAVGLAGFLLRNNRLIDHAMENPVSGFKRQLTEGITREGFWWERSPGYHFYAITPIVYLAVTALQNQYPVNTDAIKRLFDGPVALSNAFMLLPAFNDSNPTNLSDYADLYEWAYAYFRDDRYVPVISRRRSASIFSLTFRTGELPPYNNSPRKSLDMPDTKFAVLTKGSGKNTAWLALKYDLHTGGWHSQDDKLNFVLYKGQQEIAVSPGVERYGSVLHKGWFLSTFAHNTLLVDENQQEHSGGEMIAFGTIKNADFLVTRNNGAYKGVELRRSIAMLDSVQILVIDQFISTENHTYDVSYHQNGTWKKLPGGTPWIVPDKRGYKYIMNATITNSKNNQFLLTRLDSGEEVAVSVHVQAGDSLQLINGLGISRSNGKVPVMVFRRTGKSALFIWCISLDGKMVSIRSSSVKQNTGAALPAAEAGLIHMRNNAGKKWSILFNPGKLQLQDGSNEAFKVF